MNTPNRKRRLLWQIPFLLLLIIGTIYIIKQQQDTPYQHDSGTVFGTTYSIIYQSNDNLNKEIMAALNEVDQSMSTFNKGYTYFCILSFSDEENHTAFLPSLSE